MFLVSANFDEEDDSDSDSEMETDPLQVGLRTFVHEDTDSRQFAELKLARFDINI